VVQALAGRLTHVVQIARALIETQKEVLSLVEADEAIQPEMDTGVRLARRLVTPNILEYLTLGPEISLAEVQAPTFMASKTLSELDIRRRYGVTVLVIKNSGPWLGGIRTSPS
jgi:trk system potassium uptake protein TrkA